MKKNTKTIKTPLFFIIIFALFLAAVNLISPLAKTRADYDYLDFDDSNVLDDLESSKDFNLSDFPYDRTGKVKTPGIINFVEWAYGVDDMQDFGLYIYFYNPQNLGIKEDSALNVVQIATTYSSDVISPTSNPKRYEQFNLLYCNKSERENYEGLFYKFRVIDKENADGSLKLADRIYSGARRYDISGITFNTSAGIKEFTVAMTYYFEGYAAGYGPNPDAESTLKGYNETLETISLDVHSAFFRPDGSSGDDVFTRDNLHCVYFAVPNSYINKYGEMVAVHATWINAVLKTALVTGNQDAYNAILPYLGHLMTETDYDNLDYSYYGVYSRINPVIIGAPFYNYLGGVPSSAYGERIDTLYLMFNAGAGTDSADSYSVTSETLMQAMKDYSAGKTKDVNETFSSDLFSSVSERIDVNLTNDKEFKDGVFTEYSLTEQKLTQGFFKRLFGDKYESVTEYTNIPCIEAVKEFSGSQDTDCAKYYLDKSCYNEFSSFYNSNKSDNTIYIFRYMTSDYWSHEAFTVKRSGITESALDSNAYFFRQTVNVGFDIIDITFKNDNNYYVIPVVSNPMDIVYSSTPPLDTATDKNFFEQIGESVGGAIQGFFEKIGAWAVLIGGVILGLVLVFIWLNVFVGKIGKGGNIVFKIIMIILTVAALAGIIAYGYWIYSEIIALGGL